MNGIVRFWVFLALILDASAVFATAQAIVPIHHERERMSASARRQAVLDDLNSLLTGTATPTTIATVPRHAGNNLCERHVISIIYRRANEDNPKSPFRPIGLSDGYNQYHRLDYSKGLSEHEAQKACRKLDKNKDYWASSSSQATASSGLWALERAAGAVRADHGVTLDCTALHDDAMEAGCASTFLDAADRPSSVGRCPEPSQTVQRHCYSYFLGGYDVTITETWLAGRATYTIKLDYMPIIV